MSAFTEPLAQVRANTQHILEGVGGLIPGGEVHHAEDCPGCKVDAALDRVERLATDYETALVMLDAMIEADWKLGDHNPAMVINHVHDEIRAVLSAREEGTA